jgi:short-subunit dehydrogenase
VRLAGRRLLLTGASRGIGAALADAFAARGAQLALVARPSPQLDAVAERTGGTAYGCDLTDLAALPALVERVGPVDVLVNNAGVSGVGWYVDRTLAEIDQVVTLNLLAPMHLSRLVLPGMLERGRGQVVNLSSMAAVFAPPGLAAYGASKAGLSHFTAGLRADLRDDPITFTTVTLASVSTEMDDEARSYGPLRTLAEDSGGRDVTSMEDLVAAVLDGVEQDRPEVRVPRMMAPLAALTNTPRKVGRLVFKPGAARERRPRRATSSDVTASTVRHHRARALRPAGRSSRRSPSAGTTSAPTRCPATPRPDPGRRRRLLRADDVPVPVGRPAHGARRDLHDPRRAGPPPADDRPRVLNPIGWDAFGLPAENAARNRGADPASGPTTTSPSSARRSSGSGTRSTGTRCCTAAIPSTTAGPSGCSCSCSTQGLAYRREALVNWDPVDQTVLANEQVVDGRGERSGAIVERKPLTQWFFRITDYADELLDDLDTIDWPDRVKNAQRNWIGRSEGAEITFRTADGPDAGRGDGRQVDEIVVYTTRPDTIFGATYFVFAPEHPSSPRRMAGDAEYDAFLEEVSRRSDVERQAGTGEGKHGSGCPSRSSTRSRRRRSPPTRPTTC